jgi:hypothetical protein
MAGGRYKIRCSPESVDSLTWYAHTAAKLFGHSRAVEIILRALSS